MPRSFLFRFALAFAGMTLLSAVLYLGLGWAVCTRQQWLYNQIGSERMESLWNSYEHAASALRPGDRDGDGVTDGSEFFRRTDPRDPSSHDEIRHFVQTDGFSALGDSLPPQRDQIWTRFGDRTEIRCRLLLDGDSYHFSHRLQLHPIAHPHWLFARPHGNLSEEDLVVPVEEDGTFAFDLLLSTGASELPTTLLVENVVNHEPFCALEVHGFRTEFAPVTPKERPALSIEVQNDNLEGKHRAYMLDWPGAFPAAEHLLIQAGRKEAGARWFTIERCDPKETSSVVIQFVENPFLPYSGPLKFRILPVRTSLP